MLHTAHAFRHRHLARKRRWRESSLLSDTIGADMTAVRLWKIARNTDGGIATAADERRGDGRMIGAGHACLRWDRRRRMNLRGNCQRHAGKENLILTAVRGATGCLSITGLQRGQAVGAEQFHVRLFFCQGGEARDETEHPEDKGDDADD